MLVQFMLKNVLPFKEETILNMTLMRIRNINVI